ncbi:MAG TPA: MOSC domain-containing protein [Dermatophilaceae bacterium]|nr:MOSC domain-containing protein [Dermatophilaceae bacterium]
MTAVVRAVNVVHELIPGAGRMTAIDKRPVPGAVRVTALGVAGDRQADTRHHGGPDKAVYVYAAESAADWAARLGRDIPPGTFGDNLTTEGLDVDGARIGERWQVGDPDTGVLLEVRMPRTPCQNLEARMGIPGFHLQFAERGQVGAYCRVLREGAVRSGDPVAVVWRPAHDVSVASMMTGVTAYQMRELLDSGCDLATAVRRRAQRAVRTEQRRRG